MLIKHLVQMLKYRILKISEIVSRALMAQSAHKQQN